jgi:hypothetical protein
MAELQAGSKVMNMSINCYTKLSIRCIRARNSTAHYRDLDILDAAVSRYREAIMTFPDLAYSQKDQCAIIE